MAAMMTIRVPDLDAIMILSSCSRLSQLLNNPHRFFDISFEIILCGHSWLYGYHSAVAVQKEGGGQRVETAVGLADGIAIDQNRVSHAHLLDKARDLLLFFAEFAGVFAVDVVGGDGQHLEALGGVAVAQIDKPGGLDLAGSAPGGPEVDGQRMALVVRQRDFFAAEVFEREGWRGLSLQRGDVLRRAACIENQFALRSRGPQPLGGLPAVLPVCPAGPGEGGQDKENGGNDEGVALHGDWPLNLIVQRSADTLPKLRIKQVSFHFAELAS